MKIKSALAWAVAGAALSLQAMTANAQGTLTISSVTGVFDHLIGGTNVSGLGTNQVWWGGDAGLGQSGYEFVGAAPPALGPIAPDGTSFILGEFTHYNEPISSGTSITGAQLTVSVQGTLNDLGSTPVSIDSVYDIIHNETPNRAPCPPGSASTCDDIVTFALNPDASETIILDGMEYFITVEGFKIGGNVFKSFMTEEVKDNTAQLVGRLTTSAVPLPAAAWLFGSALLGMGGIGFRRYRSLSA